MEYFEKEPHSWHVLRIDSNVDLLASQATIDVTHIVFDRFIINFDVVFLFDLASILRWLQYPITCYHSIGKVLFIDPSNFDINVELLQIPCVEGT